MLIERGAWSQALNMGGRGAVSFEKAEEIFEKKISFRGDGEKQEYEMGVEKLDTLYPLRTSEEYLREYLRWKD